MNYKSILEYFLTELKKQDPIREHPLYTEYRILFGTHQINLNDDENKDDFEDKEFLLGTNLLRVKNITNKLLRKKIIDNLSKIKNNKLFLKKKSGQKSLDEFFKKNLLGFLFSDIYFNKDKMILVIPWIENLRERVEKKRKIEEHYVDSLYRRIESLITFLNSKNFCSENLDPGNIYGISKIKSGRFGDKKILIGGAEYNEYLVEALKESNELWEQNKFPSLKSIKDFMSGIYKDGLYKLEKEDKKTEREKEEKLINKGIINKKINKGIIKPKEKTKKVKEWNKASKKDNGEEQEEPQSFEIIKITYNGLKHPESSKKYEKDTEKQIETKQSQGNLERKVIYQEELIIPGKTGLRKLTEDKAKRVALRYLNGPIDKYGIQIKNGAVDKAIKIFKKQKKKLFENGGYLIERDSGEEILKHIEFPDREKGDYRKFIYVSKIKVIKVKK